MVWQKLVSVRILKRSKRISRVVLENKKGKQYSFTIIQKDLDIEEIQKAQWADVNFRLLKIERLSIEKPVL